MPEGDTVWNTARVVERALTGEVLTGSDFRVPQLATTDLTGWTVAESASRGKHLLLRLTRDTPRAAAEPPSNAEPARGTEPRRGQDGPRRMQPSRGAEPPHAVESSRGAEPPRGMASLTLHSHLRMDGAWRVYAPGERWTGRPAHLIRVVLRTARSVAVGYHLHDLALIPTEQEDRLVGHLGPDLLGADWDPAEAVRRIAAHPDVTIADALLDQRNLAGVGNLYKAETLFLRGLWPWTRVADVPDLTGTVELAQRLVASNRGRWTQTTTGSLRRGETSYVYGRRGQPCRRCRTPVRKVERDPTRDRAEVEDRITYWCPRCQPQPAGTAPL
ncbi:DNA-formamidopyrimidine glycosylase family protein [Actinoplanes oblitus]|uniref:DNA-(apurinic or apyrimidinic site) lyase n=1 Tax=Actinoplanes oblitus TaxID=3040509 RepID=A0ABY8WG71_9ACTN|nr:DNA-formamidopyrimidine glycosylase family protein [Actinoplanes oblitus]WIM95369.1 DNA-formamidopyrimidine glycosylase family protein [Actinoplanes oblitus]